MNTRTAKSPSPVGSACQLNGRSHPAHRGSQFRVRKLVLTLNRQRMVGSTGRVGAAGANDAMELFFVVPLTSVLNRNLWDSGAAPNRDRAPERADLPPAAPRATTRMMTRSNSRPS